MPVEAKVTATGLQVLAEIVPLFGTTVLTVMLINMPLAALLEIAA
jgi:hypothetical protein